MRRSLPRTILFGLGLTVFVIVSVFPLYWMFVQAVQPASQRFAFPPSLIPVDPSFDAFVQVFSSRDVGRWLGNSFLVSVTAAAATLLVGAWGGYAISRFRTRGTTAAAFLTLATQMIPPVVLMIPLFKAFASWRLVGGLEGLVLANFIFDLPVAVWMLRAVFDSVPIDVEEAALVDGCNRLSVLARVTIPLALPGVLAAGVFGFVATWEEYLFARVLISSPGSWTGSIGIASFFGEFGTPWNQVMAAALLFALPPIVLFLFVQKRFVRSMSGGLKG